MALAPTKFSPLPENHFFFDFPQPGSEFFIADFIVDGQKFLLMSNPTDCRKRMILRFLSSCDCTDIKTTMNRLYSDAELSAFYKCVGNLMICFQSYGVQLFVAGNNSHSVESDEIVIGDKEPAILHAHLVVRYLLPLSQIGEEFTLKGPKEPWQDAEQAQQFSQWAESKVSEYMKTVALDNIIYTNIG
jgi:hypothetical protein